LKIYIPRRPQVVHAVQINSIESHPGVQLANPELFLFAVFPKPLVDGDAVLEASQPMAVLHIPIGFYLVKLMDHYMVMSPENFNLNFREDSQDAMPS
jgi:hypothetical protein